jgi:hypothetical protein
MNYAIMEACIRDYLKKHLTLEVSTKYDADIYNPEKVIHVQVFLGSELITEATQW